MDACISFSSLIVLTRIFSTMLNGENGHSYFLHDLRGKAFSLSQLSMMFTKGFSWKSFIRLRKLPFYFYFDECFYHDRMSGFVKCFVTVLYDFVSDQIFIAV